MFIAFVDHKDKSGDLDKDPFNFAHFNLQLRILDLGGYPTPSNPIEADFAQTTHTKAFYNLKKL